MTAMDDKARELTLDLFGDQAEAAFERGAAAHLVAARNPHLGHLLLAERALFYVNILYRMLLFRRDHELEPLYEVVYDAVRPAQEALEGCVEYDHDQYRTDLNQLEDWELVTCRIEIDRLRGYRDTRRRKFRYRLTSECLHFLEWLEETAQTDVERSEEDARDLLEEIGACLNELSRLLNVFGTSREKSDDPRRILHRLDRASSLTTEVNVRLGDFNAVLLSFVAHQYSIDEARSVLDELQNFVDHFLRHIRELRGEILEKLEALLESETQHALRAAADKLRQERLRAPHLFRRTGDLQVPDRIPFRLWEFFREDGKLDALSQRIHDSSIKVWRKLHAHLRELERRNTRLDDLRLRTAEIAALPEGQVPHRFLRELLAPAVMVGDPNYWDEHERADPPRPRRRSTVERPPPRKPLPRKKRRRGPVVSLEQARIQKLSGWIRGVLGAGEEPDGRPLSRGAYTEPEDFRRIMELSKAGLLGKGKRLHRVGYDMSPDPEQAGRVQIDDQELDFVEMNLKRLPETKQADETE